MLRRLGVLGLFWLLAGCTEQVMLADLWDGGERDAPAGKDTSPASDADPRCGWYAPMAFTSRGAQLLVALDRSSVMQASFAGSTREKATIDALLAGMSSYQTRVKFGFEQFPADSADNNADCRSGCCAGSVRTKPGYNTMGSIRDALKCSDSGWPPCPPASYDSGSNAALDMIRNYYGGRSYDHDDHYVLMVTAAEPSCSSMSSNDACSKALDAANALGDLGARIVVLSVGYQPTVGSCLVRISKAGSPLAAPKDMSTLYVASSQDGLASFTRELFAAVAETACTMDSNDPAPSWAQLIVSIDNSPPLPQLDGGSGNGWSFANSARTTIRLTGTACQQYLSTANSTVYAGYTCSKCGGSTACPWL